MNLTTDSNQTARVAAPHRSWRFARRLSTGHSLYWWVEIACVLAFYLVYSTIRNATNANPSRAFANAKQIISFEKALHIYYEQSMHQSARSVRALIIACNYFYGSLHFVVTIGVAVFLFRKAPDHYARWRNTLALATSLALIGFWTYQLMPPRLLPASYGYIDTLAEYPTFWSFNSGAISKLSNQFAAMPSVHCAWALWCACALTPRLQQPWAKVLSVMYPITTVTVIVLTANHYFLDAIGGFAILFVGYIVAHRTTRAGRVPINTAAS